MSISAAIAPHLPYLRRFARALTGSQGGGDACVVAVLESVLADQSGFEANCDTKIALYRRFLQIWNVLDVNKRESDTEERDIAARSLEALTPRPRQAFLLTTMEGFPIDRAAAILQASPDVMADLIDQAGREIAEQVATDVLIIEDEPFIALDLEELVSDLGHRVTSLARTHSEAVAQAHAKPPGLVLADVQLADGSSGLEAANEILQHYEVPVIFITAFPERLLTGSRPEPTFLITKPFDTGMVQAVISQALFFGIRTPAAKRDAVAISA
jgi:CheY-like chemotaxis protein